jgi:hypothetical protein
MYAPVQFYLVALLFKIVGTHLFGRGDRGFDCMRRRNLCLLSSCVQPQQKALGARYRRVSFWRRCGGARAGIDSCTLRARSKNSDRITVARFLATGWKDQSDLPWI